MAEGALSVCHILNMANNGYQIVKALQNHGFDADLIIDSNDFAMGLPMWEDLDIEDDPYKIDFHEALARYELPEWVRIWWGGDGITYAHRISELFRMTRGYDILQLHASSPLYFQYTNTPYVIHEAGWIRNIAREDNNKGKLGRRAYTRAEYIVMTNPDTYELLQHLKYKREAFIPFIVDPEKYRPVKAEKHDELLFFHPSRHVWDVKGNDKLIHAFAQFLREGYLATMRIVDWGWVEDVAASKQLIEALGIEDHVEWVNPYSKPHLIKVYSECDAVFDQFIVGSGGTTCYEAMSCGVPLVIYLNHWNEKCYGEMPPVVNAYTMDEICEAMKRLTDPSYRRRVGEAERRFIYRHNHPDIIAGQFMQLYEMIMSDK